MLWVKAFHIISMVAWFAGLFYLPRLFVYHTDANDNISDTRFKTMERRLFYGIMNPAALLTIITGIWMLVDYAWHIYHKDMWLHIKLGFVMLLLIYHIYCGMIINKFKSNSNTKTANFYRIINEIPTVFLILIVIMVVVKPT